MHIPDGYLSPLFSLGTGVLTVPAWAVAVRRVQSVLNNRTVPLLAVFSAFSFTIMMFNVPVPGGTTAHGVGATLIAVVLGVPAAIIGVSMALILQALFFGDGGILAIFANCLNMAIIMPLIGYWTYRLIAGNAPLLSTRRAWSAGAGAYIGITASALATGIELGVQPLLFTDAAGHALYSPYGLAATLPSMMIAHVFGASIVEALITAMGVAYLQSRHPEYLTSRSLRSIFAGSADPSAIEVGQSPRRPLWQGASVAVLAAALLLALFGVISGGGDISHAFGADWSQVNWSDVAVMLLVVGILAVILVPLTYLILPKRLKTVGAAFMGIAILAPLGLIAPGFAFGEGSAADVGAAFGYVPKGLQQFSGFFSAPLAGYDLPFLSGGNAALWQTAIGYELSGITGILLIGGAVLALTSLLKRRGAEESLGPSASTGALPLAGETHRAIAQREVRVSRMAQVPHPHTHGGRGRTAEGHIGWFEHTVSGITSSIERSVFTEEHARKEGWLQSVDPRAKLGMFIALVLAAGLSGSFLVLAAIYACILVVARASKVPFDFFVKRVWMGIPFFAGIVILPSIFFSSGPRLFDIALGSFHIAPSIPGLLGAAVFVSRVGVSVSLAVLLVLVTPWSDVLKSLRALHVPQVFILLLSMTYRYIFLFFRITNGMFEARKSRMVGRTNGNEHRGWITTSMGNLLNRSFKISNEVYAAMLARGFGGEIRTYSAYHMKSSDWTALAGAFALAVAAFVAGRYL